MDAFCDYCGAKLDVENDNCCSKCGAPFDDNESVKQYRAEKRRREEQQRKLEEMRLRQQQQSQYNQSRLSVQPSSSSQQNAHVDRARKIVVIVVILMFFGPVLLGMLGGILGVVFDVVDDLNDDAEYTTRKPITNFVSTSDPLPKNVEVNFNETAELDGYSFICDEVYKTDIQYYTPTEGYMYVAFHFKVKNTGTSKLWSSSDVVCIVNGDENCNNIWNSQLRNFGSANLPSGVSTQGYKCFEIPVDADSVIITYGENVRVKIDLTDIEDRTESSDE